MHLSERKNTFYMGKRLEEGSVGIPPGSTGKVVVPSVPEEKGKLNSPKGNEVAAMKPSGSPIIYDPLAKPPIDTNIVIYNQRISLENLSIAKIKNIGGENLYKINDFYSVGVNSGSIFESGRNTGLPVGDANFKLIQQTAAKKGLDSGNATEIIDPVEKKPEEKVSKKSDNPDKVASPTDKSDSKFPFLEFINHIFAAVSINKMLWGKNGPVEKVTNAINPERRG